MQLKIFFRNPKFSAQNFQREGVERSRIPRYNFNGKMTDFGKNRGGEKSIFAAEFSGGPDPAGYDARVE